MMMHIDSFDIVLFPPPSPTMEGGWGGGGGGEGICPTGKLIFPHLIRISWPPRPMQ